MNPIDIHFKHSTTSDYLKLTLYKDYPISNFCIYARERINNHFQLQNNYSIVPAGTIYNEYNVPLNEDSDMVISQYTNINNNKVFYIRVHEDNIDNVYINGMVGQKTCSCCLNIYENHNLNFPALPCAHNNYCSECLNTWRHRCREQNQIYSCPECRREIVD